jgi:hypothetical protein
METLPQKWSQHTATHFIPIYQLAFCQRSYPMESWVAASIDFTVTGRAIDRHHDQTNRTPLTRAAEDLFITFNRSREIAQP